MSIPEVKIFSGLWFQSQAGTIVAGALLLLVLILLCTLIFKGKNQYLKKIFSRVLIILVFVAIFSFLACAVNNAEAYLLRAYADDPGKFGKKCPFDQTDKRSTIVRIEEHIDYSSEKQADDKDPVAVTSQQSVQQQEAEKKINAAGVVKNPKSRR